MLNLKLHCFWLYVEGEFEGAFSNFNLALSVGMSRQWWKPNGRRKLANKRSFQIIDGTGLLTQ